jgi:WD40 repeat protein
VVARFEAERQALALMDHANIAKVLDAGATETGRPYFVMELVRGIPITAFCEQNRLATHGAAIASVAFSPDCQWVITGGGDGTAKLWDATGGTESPTLGRQGVAGCGAGFSPDGRRVATAGTEIGTVRVWDATSGKELLTFNRHHAGIMSVAFSPDSQRIATGSTDGTFKVWEAANGRELLTLKGNEMWVNSVAISPDGQRIVNYEEQTSQPSNSISSRLSALAAQFERVLGPGAWRSGRHHGTAGAGRPARGNDCIGW